VKTILKPIVSAIILSSAGLAGLLQFAPGVYGSFAYDLGLPVTDRVKQANPPAFMDYQERLLAHGERKTRGFRQKLDEQRKLLEGQLEANRKEAAQVQSMLDAARRLHAETPNAPQFEFVGKRYTPAQFGQQVVVLDRQAKALAAASEALNQAQSAQNGALLKLVEKETQLASDRVRLTSNRTLYQTRQVLGDMAVEVEIGPLDFDEPIATVDHLLRTAGELAADQGRLPPPPAASGNGGIGEDALRILQGTAAGG